MIRTRDWLAEHVSQDLARTLALGLLALVLIWDSLAVAHAARAVQSCVVPAGACSFGINEVALDAAYCANILPAPVSSDVVRKCVFDQLAKAKP